ncbi:hypothetical protein J6590_069511 [Homalodisca vitripennis]|nr:hypothetical protein J6590_069511 [Homalodisca vitripennis]
MAKLWSIPSLRISRMFINATGNFFERRRFLFDIHNFFMFFSALNVMKNLAYLFMAIQEKEEMCKLVLDLLVSIYCFGIIVFFGSKHKEVRELIHGIANGLSAYATYDVWLEDGLKLKKIQGTIYLAENIILINCVKAVSSFMVWPIYSLWENEVSDPLIELSRQVMSSVCWWGEYMSSIITCVILCIYHNSWEIILANCVFCLKGELRILSGSIAAVDKRAEDMFFALDKDLRSCRWSDTLRPGVARHNQRKLDQRDNKLREICMFECLRECIRHHQDIIKTVSKLNATISSCMFLYAQITATCFALSMFLVFQAKQKFSVDVFLVTLIILPTVLSEWLLCILGQILQDEASDNPASVITDSGYPVTS